MTSIGHNSSNAQLRSIVERVERLEEERKSLGSDVKDIYLEAKSAGYDPKVIRGLIRKRAQDAQKLREYEELLAVYEAAVA